MFKLSDRSIQRLEGVHQDLIAVVENAIEISSLDFGVSEGLRTMRRQQHLVDTGKSWTLKGRHLTGHAVDLIAYDEGVVSWEMSDFAIIATAIRKSSDEINVPITWGAIWDRLISELSLEDGSFNDDIDEYIARFVDKEGRKPRLDGPHIQLAWEQYPA